MAVSLFAGAGISIVGTWFVTSIINGFVSVVAFAPVVAGLAGWLSWRWMAHAMRRPMPPGDYEGVFAGAYGFSGETYR